MENYIGLIHQEDSTYGIMFPDFPGCISAGDSIVEAIRNGTEALAFHVEGMSADGEAIPAPRTPEQIKKKDKWIDWENTILVTVLLMPAPDIKERVQLSIASRVLMHVDAITTNRSAFFEKAVESALVGKVWRFKATLSSGNPPARVHHTNKGEWIVSSKEEMHIPVKKTNKGKSSSRRTSV